MYEGMCVELGMCACGGVAIHRVRGCSAFLGIVSNIRFFAKNLVLKFLKLVEILSLNIPIHSRI